MIGHVIWRGILVAFAFTIAVGVALAVLFTLGAVWAGDELRTIAAEDPQFRELAMQDPILRDPAVQQAMSYSFGALVFVGTVLSALTALPALGAAIAGEVLHIRSWIYYVLAGGASLVAVPLLAGAQADGQALPLPASEYMTIFATAGFAGGFIYWLLAGRGA